MSRTRTMSEGLSLPTMFCSEYEALLDQCQLALSAWSERSEHARQTRITGEAVGRELLRLQASFAKSYDVLQKHIHSCEHCVAASQIGQLHLDRESNPMPVC